MSRVHLGMAAALITALTMSAAQAQQPMPSAQPQRPQIETKKVDGTPIYRSRLRRLSKKKQHRFILDDRACIFTVDLSVRQCHRFRYTINRQRLVNTRFGKFGSCDYVLGHQAL